MPWYSCVWAHCDLLSGAVTLISLSAKSGDKTIPVCHFEDLLADAILNTDESDLHSKAITDNLPFGASFYLGSDSVGHNNNTVTNFPVREI